MKAFFILLLIAAVGFAAVKFSIKSPDQSIPSATEVTEGIAASEARQTAETEVIAADRIAVSFEGFGPGGKEERGSVRASQSTLARTGNTFTGAVTFDMNTITSDPIKDGLITHLKGKDFFAVDTYPTATFTITESSDTQVRGTLTMRGVAQTVTLPVMFDATTNTYTSTVRVNKELFGIKQTFTDDEFVLSISIR